ncbi:uncharacterized protein LOC114910215 [Scleropages formosus]|uniref:uncharacterized protein LOC114910215 n=1 Tax=Scleropages formosus TaxID=113540 RepID=UPI0010FA960F|nr:uncharacterized protein LOC114910215 [Scleropages formosus]
MALHHTLQHLDCSRTYVRMLFLDYSSDFNTIRPGKLITKLTDLGVQTTTCNWILDFLTDRPQVVRMGRRVSGELTVSTGSPQGCCLSPKLFTLYTYDCDSTQDDTVVIKYANDMTILGLIKNEDESGYRASVNSILVYGEENDLVLNVDKMRELIIDFRKKSSLLHSLIIRGTEVERVDSHKFLGLQAGVSVRPLTQAYGGLVESILTTAITVWYGNTTQAERKALQRVLIGPQRHYLAPLHSTRVEDK